MALFDISHKDVEPKSQRPFHMGAGITRSDNHPKGSQQVGFAVTPSGNYAANVGADGDPVLGLLIVVEYPDAVSTKGTVRVAGNCEFASTGTINVGDKVVCSGTAGAVRAATTGDELSARGIVTAVLSGNRVVVEL